MESYLHILADSESIAVCARVCPVNLYLFFFYFQSERSSTKVYSDITIDEKDLLPLECL